MRCHCLGLFQRSLGSPRALQLPALEGSSTPGFPCPGRALPSPWLVIYYFIALSSPWAGALPWAGSTRSDGEEGK